jgi:hypothetical protein
MLVQAHMHRGTRILPRIHLWSHSPVGWLPLPLANSPVGLNGPTVDRLARWPLYGLPIRQGQTSLLRCNGTNFFSNNRIYVVKR